MKLISTIFLFSFIVSLSAQTTIRMEKENGVYIVPCKVNNLSLKFIFDTGASDVTISLTEALFMLKNDYLKEDDIIGTSYAELANGDITENTGVILRKFEFAGLTLYNVKASVVHELKAPLLLGQSAISRLGTIQIDPATNTLTILNKGKNTFNYSQNNNSHSTTIPNNCKDFDGNIYPIVKIGNQVWMKENLKTTHYNDGTAIPNVIDETAWSNLFSPAYCWYNNDAHNYKNTYGALYNWYAVNTDKLCPIGWHVPDTIEWNTLTTYLGGKSVAGGKMKEPGTTHWSSSNTCADNSSGFTALPAGDRNGYVGGFLYLGYNADFGSSTVNSADDTWYYCLGGVCADVEQSNYVKSFGFSVRCLRDK